MHSAFFGLVVMYFVHIVAKQSAENDRKYTNRIHAWIILFVGLELAKAVNICI